MLVLTRRRGEGVVIGPDIRVVVLGIKNGQVRLGIEAPRTIEVHRDEVCVRIQDENQTCSTFAGGTAGCLATTVTSENGLNVRSGQYECRINSVCIMTVPPETLLTFPQGCWGFQNGPAT